MVLRVSLQLCHVDLFKCFSEKYAPSFCMCGVSKKVVKVSVIYTTEFKTLPSNQYFMCGCVFWRKCIPSSV